jgi:Ser/Thr protein kinase RdoA (MazF antagonist)
MTALPELYRSLLQQIVHRDFDASNVLMEGDRVTGVLDFEFAGSDLRAFDLARSLSLFSITPWSIPDGWERVRAFIEGYRKSVELTTVEVEALPQLMRLYRTWSLVHREGRHRQELASEEDVRARARGLLRQDEWLSAHHQDLARLVALDG